MSTEQADTKSFLIRDMPVHLINQIDEYAQEVAGETANPSRTKATIALIERGLNDAKRKR